MFEAFIIVLREGFEAFLIVAIIFTYLKKTDQKWLQSAVYCAIAAAIASSLYMGYLLKQGVNESLWAGIFGLIAIVLIATLIIHMRRVGPKLSGRIHDRLNAVSTNRPRWLSFLGVFFFSVLMITREGMETAFMLAQVRGDYFTGAILGLAGATVFAILWARFGHLVNMKRFFQVTSLFLLLFIIQVALYTFHEFAETGLFGERSDAWHAATEVWSPEGLYGRWISLGTVAFCALWLAGAWIGDRVRRLPSMATPAAK